MRALRTPRQWLAGIAILLLSAPYAAGPDLGPSSLPPTSGAGFLSADISRAGVLISRVYANTERDDEFVELANLGDTVVDLANWSLSDREGNARFPEGTRFAPASRITVTANATSYEEDLLVPPDFTWRDGDAPLLGDQGLRLANDGDEVLLIDPEGTLQDAFVYGDSTYVASGWVGESSPTPGRGYVSVRRTGSNGLVDTDTSSDWAGPRSYRLGQSEFHPPETELADRPVPFLSPDDRVTALTSFLSSATESIEVAVYTLTSDEIAASLADRARVGVRVRILLEGAPVGGVDDHERQLVAGLVNAGAVVRWLESGPDAVKRYRYLHAKYALVDGTSAFISSENFGESGFPSGGTYGNRGWSIAVHDIGLAGQLWEVFEEDFDPRRADSVQALGDGVTILAHAGVAPIWRPAQTRCCTPARLVVGPDNALDADRILGLLASARERIWIEAFYMQDPWPTGPNPFLEAAFEAARRGVSVKILLDRSPWTAEDAETGNEALVREIGARARSEGLDVEARLHADTASVHRIHNKGVIVDGHTVLISSLNWAYVSATQDREIGLIVDDVDIAERFESAFVADWDGRGADATASGPRANLDQTLMAYAAVVGVSLLSLWKLRPGNKGTSGRFPLKRRGARAHLRRGRGEVRLLPSQLVAEPGARPRRRRPNRRG